MQTLMDVTGNNIANVNTTGYKTTITVFEDTLSQTLANATTSTGSNGGTNPAQVGLGVRVASITNNFTEGAAQTTGVNSNMMLNGDGFFVVRNNGINEYTRNGAFTPDSKGELVNANGSQLMGWQADSNGAVVTNATTAPITIPTGLLSNPRPTGAVVLSGNLNNAATGETTAGDGLADAAGSTIPINYAIYDKQGKSSDIALMVTPQAQTDSALGTTISQWNVTGSYGNPAQTFAGTITMNPDGTKSWADSGSGNTTADDTSGNNLNASFTVTGLTGSDGAAFNVDFDLSKLTSSAQSGQSSSAKVDSQDGHAAASLSGWRIGSDGTITGTFSDGTNQTLAKIAVATFDNPQGLEKMGDSTYAASVNSGSVSIGVAGDGNRGTITAGALEMSNVDLSQEFTNLIIAQRGFQANSKVITTSDDILQTLVNLKS
jgi:flagellar hook protein FlgE